MMIRKVVDYEGWKFGNCSLHSLISTEKQTTVSWLNNIELLDGGRQDGFS